MLPTPTSKDDLLPASPQGIRHGPTRPSALLGLLALLGLSCSRSPHSQPAQSQPASASLPSSSRDAPPAPPQASVVAVPAPLPAEPPAGAQKPDRLLQVGHTSPVDALAFSPDRRWLASGSGDKTIRIWDVETGRSLRTLTAHAGAVWSVAFSPDGRRLASASQDGTVRVWDAASGASLYTLALGKAATSVVFSPDNRLLVASAAAAGEGAGSTIEIHDAPRGGKLRTIALDWNSATPLAIAPDGRLLSSGGAGEDGEYAATKIWDLATGKELATDSVSVQAFSPDGHWMASVAYAHGATITLRDAVTGKRGPSWAVPDINVQQVLFSPDGTRVVTVEGNGAVTKVWEAATGKELATLGGEESPAPGIAWSSDGRLLAVGNAPGYSVAIWDVAAARQLHVLEGQTSVGAIAFASDGLLLASSPNGLHVWDVAAGQDVALVPDVGGGNLVVAPDGRWLASTPHGQVKVWETRTWTPARVSPPQSAYIWWIGFASTPLPPATVSSSVKSWQIGDSAATPAVWGSTYPMAISPDRRLLAVGHDRGGSVEIWDAAAAIKLTTLAAHRLGLSVLAFSPDGQWLLTAGQETPLAPEALRRGEIRAQFGTKLWDVKTWRERWALSVGGGGVAAFSPDSRLLAQPSGPDMIQLVDVAQGTPVRRLAGSGGGGGSIAFSPDGGWLVQATPQGVDVWQLTAVSR